MPIKVRQVTGRRELRKFLGLPERLNRSREGWVPPLRAEERRFLEPAKNPAFSYCDCTLVLAYRDGRAVGRIIGIVNRRYNELRNERTARFSHLECIEDQEVAHGLLGYVERWAAERGMNRVIGPMGFTDQDPEGFLVEGFGEETALASNQNPEYLVRLVEAAGYDKHADYVVYRIPVPEELPEFYRRISQRTLRRGIFTLLEFDRRRALKPFVRPILELMNETYGDLVGFSPLDDDEMDDLTRRYLPVIDPRFVKIVMAHGQPAGFIVGIPNLNEGLRRAKGRLLPLGWLKIVRAAKRARRLDLLLGGIKEEFRGRGIDVLLGSAMIRSAREAGFEYMDSHHELESNYRVRAEMERMGGRVYKRYRIFQRRL
ncbi:MAG: hypothetical protein JSV41_12995 [Gemmatimonadota bacterium]|nr:MAG: hypothetical protein JSV41_12995 [Gemmatimonadota bacterium]